MPKKRVKIWENLVFTEDIQNSIQYYPVLFCFLMMGQNTHKTSIQYLTRNFFDFLPGRGPWRRRRWPRRRAGWSPWRCGPPPPPRSGSSSPLGCPGSPGSHGDLGSRKGYQSVSQSVLTFNARVQTVCAWLNRLRYVSTYYQDITIENPFRWKYLRNNFNEFLERVLFEM